MNDSNVLHNMIPTPPVWLLYDPNTFWMIQSIHLLHDMPNNSHMIRIWCQQMMHDYDIKSTPPAWLCCHPNTSCMIWSQHLHSALVLLSAKINKPLTKNNNLQNKNICILVLVFWELIGWFSTRFPPKPHRGKKKKSLFNHFLKFLTVTFWNWLAGFVQSVATLIKQKNK